MERDMLIKRKNGPSYEVRVDLADPYPCDKAAQPSDDEGDGTYCLGVYVIIDTASQALNTTEKHMGSNGTGNAVYIQEISPRRIPTPPAPAQSEVWGGQPFGWNTSLASSTDQPQASPASSSSSLL